MKKHIVLVLALLVMGAAVVLMTGAGTDINGNRTVEGNLTVKGTCTGCGGGGASITQGTFASLPGTCTTNDLYYFTDSLYTVARCSATNTWTEFYDGKTATPWNSGSTWSNQSTCTIDATFVFSVITVPTGLAGGLCAQYVAISSSGNYSHVFRFRITTTPNNGLTRFAPVMLSDATLCLIVTPYVLSTDSHPNFTVTSYTNTACSAGGSNPVGDVDLVTLNQDFYVKVVDNGSTLAISFSGDGAFYNTAYSASRTAIFSGGATRLGWGGYLNSSTQTGVVLVSYQ